MVGGLGTILQNEGIMDKPHILNYSELQKAAIKRYEDIKANKPVSEWSEFPEIQLNVTDEELIESCH